MDPEHDPVESVTSLVHNRANPVTRDVLRVVVSDTTGVPSGVTEASSTAVVKTLCRDGAVVVPHWTAGADPTHWNYWNREALAYVEGVTDAFAAGGIRGPKLLDVVESPDGSIQLWLEEVEGRSGHGLTFDDHLRFARGLGVAQGTLSPPSALGQSLMSLPFLSKGWVRSYALSRPAGPVIHEDAAAWEHPVVIAGFGEQRHRLRARFGELYKSAPAWFHLLESLPRTLCHLDYWPNNAIAAGSADRADDVLIDWAFAGVGAIGEDPGNWVPDTIFDHFMDPERFEDLDERVWQAYAAGLEESGWQHPIELARLGMCASAIKYVWLPGLMVSTADHTGPTGYGGQQSYPLVEVFRRRGVVFERLLGWLDEAASLARALGVDLDI